MKERQRKILEYKERQRKILEYIESYTIENRCPPTVRDIQNKFSIKSTSTVYFDIKTLLDMGLVEKINGKVVPVYSKRYVNKLLEYISNQH